MTELAKLNEAELDRNLHVFYDKVRRRAFLRQCVFAANAVSAAD